MSRNDAKEPHARRIVLGTYDITAGHIYVTKQDFAYGRTPTVPPAEAAPVHSRPPTLASPPFKHGESTFKTQTHRARKVDSRVVHRRAAAGPGSVGAVP